MIERIPPHGVGRPPADAIALMLADIQAIAALNLPAQERETYLRRGIGAFLDNVAGVADMCPALWAFQCELSGPALAHRDAFAIAADLIGDWLAKSGTSDGADSS